MAFLNHHAPANHSTLAAFEQAFADRYRHAARWLRAAALMKDEERVLAQAMQTPLAVIKPANAAHQ